MKCAPAQRCLVCQVKLNHPLVQEDFISPPDYSDAMIFSLVQAGPLFPGGAMDAATLEAAQRADPALRRVREWFPAGKAQAHLAPAQVSADLESEGGPEMSWYVSNRKKLRMVSMGKDKHHIVGILKNKGELGQGEGQVASVVPPELRGQVIEFSHTKAHLGEAKTLAGITRYFSWAKMKADVHRYIEHCSVLSLIHI